MFNSVRYHFYQLLEVCKGYVPAFVRSFIRKYWSLTSYDAYRKRRLNPFFHDDSEYNATGSPCRLGIIVEINQYHKHYIAACRELGISYKLIDLFSSDWIDKIRESQCDAFLVWPSSVPTCSKEMFDDRLRIMVNVLDKIIYPSLEELWLYESKYRQHYWLTANEIPHPRTWVFTRQDDALDFLKDCKLPLVFKTNIGAAANGVYILKTVPEAKKIVCAAFSKGIRLRRGDPMDRQRGAVYFQEYFDDFREWRMVRIGDSFFGHLKERDGVFHSGSGLVKWEAPSVEILDFLKMVTDKGNFTSMDVDVFETHKGFLVNELQTVFGASISVDQMKIDGKKGRFVYHDGNNSWIFEEGGSARNACANLRVEYLLKNILSE